VATILGTTLEVVTKQEAVVRRLTRFYTGNPCRHGHHAERYTSNGHCVTCNAASARAREARRSEIDPSYRMYRNTLRRTGMALQGRASPVHVLGCEQPRLRDFIEQRFKRGMTWERYRQWEVDHVLPIGLPVGLDELVRRCHYSNLQPLWKSENRAKGGA
jgi:hypothetical protein